MSATLDDGPAPRELRETLGRFASGITVICAMRDGQPVGMTCQSFYSVSLRPPLVSVCVGTTSTTYPRIRAAGTFCVNVLSHTQDRVSRQFAGPRTDRWAGIDWTTSTAGNPVLDDCLIWVDCELVAEHPAGDHYVIIGRVAELGPPPPPARAPLLYYRGAYHTVAELTDTAA